MNHRLSQWVYPSVVALYAWLRNVVALFLCGTSLGWLVGMSTSPVLQTVLAALLAIVATLLTATLGLPRSTDNKKVSLTDVLSSVLSQAFGQSVTEKTATNPASNPETVPAKPVSPYNALPLGWFLFCLAVGAAGGIFTRTNELLGTIPRVVAWRLSVNPNDSVFVAKQVLAEQYGLAVAKTKNSTTNAAPGSAVQRFSAAALFSDTKDSVDFCASVRFLNGPELQDELSQQVAGQLNRSPDQSKRRELEHLQGVLAKEPNERVLQQIKNRLCLQQ
ncbi:hypothetical protein HNV11_15075 [Spirosoma taeanense]|uniref:Uncharacterized protein n=1 Tax=Spirosoma taeanense TaxID=2735870 RepID=A0A6M5YBI0_9BACT|nr:hypothetical protein [Spirosoma taeanense]QJW90611.1 hypothetical protein HNV11_15075 [Spirosoma taeanense]